ncbi:MAG: hypothetical protein ACRED2_04150, partial [Methylocella sp.]
MRMLVAFFAGGMLAIMACTFSARAGAAAAPVAEDELPGRSSILREAVLQEALAADKRQDYATTLALLRPLAERGNAYAQLMLAAHYHDGLGVPQDYAEAF